MDSFPVSDSNPKTPQKGQVSNQLYLNQQSLSVYFIIVQQLAAHATPFNLLCVSEIHFVCRQKSDDYPKLSCIPPHLRQKTDWLRTAMDAIVENDTHETHWELSRDDSDRLLSFLFPDEVLFPKSTGELAEKSDHFTMEQVLNNCITKGLYVQAVNPDSDSSEEKPTKDGQKTTSHWSGAPKLDAKAPTARKSSLASFFNKVIVAVNKACVTVTIR